MSGIRAATVLGVRAVVLWALRIVGLGLTAWGAYQVASRLTFGLLTGAGLEGAWTVYTDVGSEHGIYRGLPACAIGLALALFSRPMARWIVRPPEQGCPRCGYADAVDARRCPECGFASSNPSGAVTTAGRDAGG